MTHANIPFSESREVPGLHIKLSKGRGTAHVREERRASGVAEHGVWANTKGQDIEPRPKLRLSSSGSKAFPAILPSLTEPTDEVTPSKPQNPSVSVPTMLGV